MSSDIARIVVAQAEAPDSDAEEALTGTEPEAGPSDIGEVLAEEVQSEVGARPDDSGMPQLDFSDYPPQLVWLAITFVALYFLMSRIALPRIATVLESRRDRIAQDLDTAARLKTETDEVIAAYEAELAEARGKAHSIAQETREKLNAQLAKERAEVEDELANRVAQAEERIGEARSSAMAEIETTAADAARDIVDALIGQTPTDKEVAAALKAAQGA